MKSLFLLAAVLVFGASSVNNSYVRKTYNDSIYYQEPEEYAYDISTLLAAYPDRDNWISNYIDSDVPRLADPAYIRASVRAGMFNIGTPEELASYCYYNNVRESGATVPATLIADIDLKGFLWAPMGWTSGRGAFYFNSVFSGEGHTISNLTIESTYADAAFIGSSAYAYVSDLRIVNASISGGSFAAVLNAYSLGSVFENCYVQGEINGYGSIGAMVGQTASGSTLRNCSADVLVNGAIYNFLTYSDKVKSENEPTVRITIDEYGRVTRPELEGYRNLGWSVYHDGALVLDKNAEGESLSIDYNLVSPGKYEIYLTAYISGQYVPISNSVHYEIKDYGGDVIITDKTYFVKRPPFSLRPENKDAPVKITIDKSNKVTKPKVDGYRNLAWIVLHNGEQVLQRGAENETSFTYDGKKPGTYEIYLQAFVGGGYRSVSNTVYYVLK